jgi:DNA-directed RNA polymerase specialized sigma24 family protein
VIPSARLNSVYVGSISRVAVNLAMSVVNGVVAAAKAGDEAASGVLAERHRGELRVHCYRMVGSFTEAEGLVQETFLRTWRGLAGFEGRSTVRAWLCRIATNACLDVLGQPADGEIASLRLTGVRITGPLDLEHATVPYSVRHTRPTPADHRLRPRESLQSARRLSVARLPPHRRWLDSGHHGGRRHHPRRQPSVTALPTFIDTHRTPIRHLR